jgi:hypothetical protein
VVILTWQVLDEKPANPVDLLETALLNKKAAGGAGNTEVVGPAAVSSSHHYCMLMASPLLLAVHVLSNKRSALYSQVAHFLLFLAVYC